MREPRALSGQGRGGYGERCLLWEPQDYGALNNHLSTTLHVFNHLVQRARQTAIELACISSACLPTHSQSSHIIPCINPPSNQPFHSPTLHQINCSIIYPSSINSYTHSHILLSIQPPQPFILYQFNHLNSSSCMNLTMSPIPFNHSNNQFNMFVPMSLPSSPWQTHLRPPNPPSKLQQHQSNWETTSV